MPLNFTIAHQKFTPWRQVAATVVIALVGMLAVKLSPLAAEYEYFVVMVSLVFFAIFNTIISLAYPSFFRYTVPSWYMYIAMAAVLLLTAKFLSGISIWDLWAYQHAAIAHRFLLHHQSIGTYHTRYIRVRRAGVLENKFTLGRTVTTTPKCARHAPSYCSAFLL